VVCLVQGITPRPGTADESIRLHFRDPFVFWHPASCPGL